MMNRGGFTRDPSGRGAISVMPRPGPGKRRGCAIIGCPTVLVCVHYTISLFSMWKAICTGRTGRGRAAFI